MNLFTVSSTTVDPATWSDATNHPFFVILNVAIGGGFPAAFGGGPTASTASGVPMLVDYVRVYRRAAAFADDDLEPGKTVVRAVHLLELRNRINSVRTARGLSPFQWAESIEERTTLIRASHIDELRAALSEAFRAAGMTEPQFDPSLTMGALVTASHVAELRSAVGLIE